LNYTEPDFVCVVYNGGDFGDIPSCGVCNVVYNVVYNEATPHDGVCASETWTCANVNAQGSVSMSLWVVT
jgi:hypothetical protein